MLGILRNREEMSWKERIGARVTCGENCWFNKLDGIDGFIGSAQVYRQRVRRAV